MANIYYIDSEVNKNKRYESVPQFFLANPSLEERFVNEKVGILRKYLNNLKDLISKEISDGGLGINGFTVGGEPYFFEKIIKILNLIDEFEIKIGKFSSKVYEEASTHRNNERVEYVNALYKLLNYYKAEKAKNNEPKATYYYGSQSVVVNQLTASDCDVQIRKIESLISKYN